MLEVTANDNQVAVIHSISHLLIPPGYKHQNHNGILELINDADTPKGLLQILKLNCNNFKGRKHWFCHDYEYGPQYHSSLKVTEQNKQSTLPN